MVVDPHRSPARHGEQTEGDGRNKRPPGPRRKRVNHIGNADGEKQKRDELHVVKTGDERRPEPEYTDDHRDHPEIPCGRHRRGHLLVKRRGGLAARWRRKMLLLFDLSGFRPDAVGPVLALVAEKGVVGPVLHLPECLESRLGIVARLHEPVTLCRDVLWRAHHLPHVALVKTFTVVTIPDLVDHLAGFHEKKLVVTQLKVQKRAELVIHQRIEER